MKPDVDLFFFKLCRYPSLYTKLRLGVREVTCRPSFQPVLLRPHIAYRREIVETPDGDIVAWDWSTPEPADLNAPVLVHFHGLEGGSDSHYAEALMAKCAELGWRGLAADL